MPKRSCAFLMIAVLGLCGGSADGQRPLVAVIRISSTTRVKPGVYRLADPGTSMVQISGAGFTVDLRGVRIVGPGANRGIGIHITNAHNVTVQGAHVTGCLWGIMIEHSTGVRLLNCTASHNGDLPPGTVIDESGREPEDQHGGGMLLRDSQGCLVRHCVAQHQWDGIDVVRADGNVIEDGDFSYCGNWGLHLWSSSENMFRRNRAIWCTTGEGTLFQALTGWQTYDAQAVGIDHASCDNVIEENDLRFGGDGIFIRANEGGAAADSPVPPLHSSDRNILRGNDCSFSPNNAIEADFIAGTIIEDNNCSNSHFGMWLGYSRGSIVRRNTCLNDTARAIEIENGQNSVIEGNLFGFDQDRGAAPLIYLRQNGRDRTPSGPYIIHSNHFFGTTRCVLLRDTRADLADNTVIAAVAYAATLVTQESPGSKQPADVGAGSPRPVPRVTEARTHFVRPGDESGAPRASDFTVRHPLVQAGRRVTVGDLETGGHPVAIELDGIPVCVQRTSGGDATFNVPTDFWDRPVPQSTALRVYTGSGWSSTVPLLIYWPPVLPRIERISPNPARIGDTVTVEGANLGEEVMLNGRPVVAGRAGRARLNFKAPEGILVSTRYNLIVRASRSNDVFSWPVTFEVHVPREAQPHLLSATFSPTTLRVGDVLTVTFTVRNNLPVPARLLTTPAPGYTYDENKAGWEIGVQETPGTLHLRVTSDHPGPNDPGSWPWFFGFDRDRLASGETVTISGHIRVQTSGVHEFRVGLVASGVRFIDDNAFRTKITVLPK